MAGNRFPGHGGTGSPRNPDRFLFLTVRTPKASLVGENIFLVCFLRIHYAQSVINNPTQLSGRGFPYIFYMKLFLSQLYVFLVLANPPRPLQRLSQGLPELRRALGGSGGVRARFDCKNMWFSSHMGVLLGVSNKMHDFVRILLEKIRENHTWAHIRGS